MPTYRCKKSEKGIDLRYVPKTKETADLFVAAGKMGNGSVLSELDAEIWAADQIVFLKDKIDEYPKCGSSYKGSEDDSCILTDFIYWKARPESWRRSVKIPKIFYNEKMQQIEQAANKFLEDAKMLLKKCGIKIREVELDYDSWCSEGRN